MKRKVALNVLCAIPLLVVLGLSGCLSTSDSSGGTGSSTPGSTRSNDQQIPLETPEQQPAIKLQSSSIAAGDFFTIGLKSDGTVLALGQMTSVSVMYPAGKTSSRSQLEEATRLAW